MKPYLKNKGWKAFALISLSFALSACDTGAEAPVERKKMPRFNGSELLQDKEYFGTKNYSACGMDFEADLVYMQDGYGSKNYMCIPLETEEMDEAALKILEMFKPFASLYLAQWSKLQSKGIMLDLRTNRQQMSLREDYYLSKENTFKIPVVLLWDAGSAKRVRNFIGLLNNLPDVKNVKANTESFNF